MSKKKKCSACNGTGVQYSEKEGLRVRCPVCLGSGESEDIDKGGYY